MTLVKNPQRKKKSFEEGIHTLVIVESPGKVKTITQYLGPGYKVMATYGHVRSLPSRPGAVRPDEDFTLIWETLEKSQKALEAICQSIENVQRLVLATDMDREGEAISWHVLEYLKEKGKIHNNLRIDRVSFNAITKEAIHAAMNDPRDIDEALVHAYLARLSLDYLVGFTLSPVLWRKIPGSRSAGRVQSVALRLVSEKEKVIKNFCPNEYWSLEGIFSLGKKPKEHLSEEIITLKKNQNEKEKNTAHSPENSNIVTNTNENFNDVENVTKEIRKSVREYKKSMTQGILAHVIMAKGKKLEKMTINNQEQAQDYLKSISPQEFYIKSQQTKNIQRHPSPPFITSTLQQEASRKLGYSPAYTMSLAQKLYEGANIEGKTLGLITYMRTDSVLLSPEAIKEQREFIEKTWGSSYIPQEEKKYKNKNRAQEAHEAIRPTQCTLTPQKVRDYLPLEQFLIYKLIWERSLASQMSSAQLEQNTITLSSVDDSTALRATGSRLIFDGFLVLYEESKEDQREEEDYLPFVEPGTALTLEALEASQHFTQPPPRYSEASLVEEMEDLSIGRPSTYARILQVLQERDYVNLDKKRMVPRERGGVVTAFLCHFFPRYVDYGFTADLENKLDLISQGHLQWKELLREFWPSFHNTCEKAKELTIPHILDVLSPELVGEEMPLCPHCTKSLLTLKIGKMGPYMACGSYPECTYTQDLSGQGHTPTALGIDPNSGEEVCVKKGPYGWYVEQGEKRISIPSFFDPEALTKEQGLFLLSLPKSLGLHPETQKEVFLSIGRFGPYIKYDGAFYSLRNIKELENFTLEQSLPIIRQPKRAPKQKTEAPTIKTENYKGKTIDEVKKEIAGKKSTRKKNTEEKNITETHLTKKTIKKKKITPEE